MAKVYDGIDARLAQFIRSQPVFFVASAPLAADGHVNCSPKGNHDSLVVLDDRRIAYHDLTGSGVETIAHLRENGRIVVMFCSFEGPPRIVRLHGRGRAVTRNDADYDALAPLFPESLGTRAFVVVDVERVSDSCGYGVPLMPFREHRDNMDHWAQKKGPEGVAAYQAERNATSVDGLPGLAPA